MTNGEWLTRKIYILIGICVCGLALSLWAFPSYRVYYKQLHGKAQLEEAKWNKKIEVEAAVARKDAAAHLAAAEVARARGVAQANEIIGESLKNNEQYLRYLWIQGLQDGSSEVIYIPTEAGIPILEAGKR
jgi:hypothetical protein